MGRVLNLASGAIRDRLRLISEGWNAFWFSPADPTLLGVLRILAGLMLLYTHGVWGLALNDFFGPDAWLSVELVRTLQEYQFAYSFWWWIEPDWMWTAYGLSMLVLAMFTVGLWTRMTSVLSLIVAISFAYRAPEAQFGLDQINIMLTLYLAIGDSGRAVSLDRWIARSRGKAERLEAPSLRSNLGQRLIQVHMCTIYFFAGISKLQGLAWWDGEAMWLAFANLEYQSMDMTWMSRYPLLVNVATHATILWEVFFCALIWNRFWRPIFLTGGFFMHLGIGACLGMWTFGLIMLVGCASFLPNDRVRQLVELLTARRSRVEAAPSPLAAMAQTASAAHLGGPHRPAPIVVSIDYGPHRYRHLSD